MLVNIIQNTISSFRSALADAGVITTNLKMWLGFETSETLGAEKVVDGNFPLPNNNWALDDGWSINNGKATYDGTAPNNAISQTLSITIGAVYKLQFTVEDYVSGALDAALSNGSLGSNSIIANGTYSFDIIATGTLCAFRSTDSFDGSISNVSVKELTQFTPDKSGNNNVGELFTGKALEFDGSTEYVDVDGFKMSGNVSTFAFWINSNDTLGRIIDINPNRFIISFESNQLSLYDGSWKNFGTISTNVWNRCVIVTNNTSAKCYVNGVQLGVEKTITAINIGSATSAIIGANYVHNQSFFDGEISDFQIYNAAWSQDDITYDYANPNKLAIDNPSTSLVVTNLKGYWAMSEGAGSLAYDSANAIGVNVVIDGDFPLPNVNWDLVNEAQITVNGLKIDNTVLNNFVGAKQFLTNSPFGKTFVATYDITATNGTELAIQQAVDVTLDTTTIGTNKKTTFTWSRAIDELTIKRKGGQTGVNVTIDNFSLQEISVGIINGATYEPAQPRIPQLGMQNWAKSTPVADEITLIPNPTIPTQDIFGNAVRDRLNSFNLDGSGYAEVADDASINPTTEITVQCWIQSNTETNRGLVAKWNNAVQDYMLLKFTQNFRFYIGVNWGESGTIPTSGWVNIAGTYDGSNIKTYINGVLSTTTALTGSIPNNSNTLDIGRYNEANGTPYSERISDVLLYDTALTATEIENNYNAGLSAHTN